MTRPGRNRALATALAGIAAFAALACRPAETPTAVQAVRPEATLDIEPPVVRAGDVTAIDIAVRTPPDHHLAPWRPPEVSSLWLLEVETLPTHQESGQWIHRLRVRVRPREIGVLQWPDGEVRVIDIEDRETVVRLPGRSFEVVTALATPRERIRPYGMLRPDPAPSGGWGLAAGSAALLGALAALAAQAAWRRARPRAGSSEPSAVDEPEVEPDLFEWARSELAEASAQLETRPLDAASRAAHTLRAFVARRFRAPVLARTTPELDEGDPPFAARSRWPYFLRLLGDLDDLRFRARRDETEAREIGPRARAAVEESLRFVEETRPARRPR